MFILNEKVTGTVCGDGISRKILGDGGSLTMVEVTFRKNAAGDMHSHAHEQVSYIVSGSFEFTLEAQTNVLGAGDSVYIPSGALHGVKALEERSVLIDVFTPHRDF